MATFRGASSLFVQPMAAPGRRLSVAFQMASLWRGHSSRYNHSPLVRFASNAKSRDSSEAASSQAAMSTGGIAVEQSADSTERELSGSKTSGEVDTTKKKPWNWRPGHRKEEEEDVVLKVLPSLGEPRAVKFRLGKKHITMEDVRERSLAAEDILEPKSSEETSTIVAGNLPKTSEDNMADETSKLVQNLERKLSLSEKDQRLYSNALPSVFGISVGVAKQVAMTINRAGFKKSEVSAVFPRFPSVLDVNFEKVARVYKVLQKEYKMNRRWLQGLMIRHPYVFMLEEEKVREKMDAMVELGLKSREIATLILQHPLLLFTSLSSETIERANQASEAGLSSSWLTKSLLYNLHYRPARLEFGDDIERVVELLEEYDVNIAEVLTAQPQLLTLQSEDMEAIINILSSSPLYLNSQDIRFLLDRRPSLFSITGCDALQSHLNLLCEVLGSCEYVRFMVRSVVGLLHPDCDIQGKLVILSANGFSKEQSTSLISQCPSVLSHDTATEFAPKVELLMRIAGVNPTLLATSPRAYFLTPLNILQVRYDFARQHKKELLKASRLSELFCSTDRDFVSLCGSRLTSYYSETGLTPTVRKRGRPRKQATSDYLPQFTGTQASTDDMTKMDDISPVIGIGNEIVELSSESDLEKGILAEHGVGTAEDGMVGVDCEVTHEGVPTSSARKTDENFHQKDDFEDLLQYSESSSSGGSGSSGHVTDGISDHMVSNLPRFDQDVRRQETLSLWQNNRGPFQDTIVPKTSRKSTNSSLRESVSQSNPSPSFLVFADAGSANGNQRLDLAHKATVMSDKVCGVVDGGEERESLSDLATHEAAAVVDLAQGEIQDNSLFHSDEGEGEGEGEGGGEEGSVDLDGFVSKEVSDLLQELRRESITRDIGQSLFVKGVAKMSEFDVAIDDGLPLDFVEDFLEIDQTTHSISRRSSTGLV